MNIGQASKASGVSVKMIRYYDEVGLVRPSSRSEGNYREYDAREINELRFIKRARSLGFDMAEIAQLLSLWRDRERSSREVKAIAQRHLADLDTRIREMQAMADTLRHLAHCCAGDDRPDCPILEDLSGTGAAQTTL
ncbi:Cu(I)-responsive transcriptional regulator [Nitrospirillum amazonense]|uniref:Cu(I)-responsive transcriptional regulator n=1 Tax=Nitrospirillum amazonense TaxID=28077 RepID=A0A560K9S9_9PROT|nr:Cu(I)-responsive transcriptional regulator [Nitrospirillum amazonense]MDG3441499.1 Cu(I)-responsive transcriptional regulator [Nitrospirillum amazonense]TWB80007.1 Cu(I)-responsive transcriptional regulator [Nitrospirillum amazonense]